MLEDWQDAFGYEIYDYFTGQGGFEIVERDDGFFSTSGGPEIYFSEFDDWPKLEQEAMTYVRGRALDVGCGAGRHALYLQGQGFDVVGVDNSPLAIKVCRERGLRDARVYSITQLARQLGVFDTILMLGNNFALVGNPTRARWLLSRFYGMTTAQGRIIASAMDPYRTDLPEHLDYHEQNRKKGKMPGEVRIRVRYKRYVTPWIDFLLLSKDEMEVILGNTKWVVKTFIDQQQAFYIAILEKARR